MKNINNQDVFGQWIQYDKPIHTIKITKFNPNIDMRFPHQLYNLESKNDKYGAVEHLANLNNPDKRIFWYDDPKRFCR